MAERIDPLHLKGVSIIQDKDKFCYGIDAVLLADFVLKDDSFKENCPKPLKIYDLGTGNGIIPVLIVSQCLPQSKERLNVCGIEIQPAMADMARRTMALNSISDKVSVIEGDIKEIHKNFIEGCADIVVSNPPYMIPSKGRVSSNIAKMTARQELFCSLNDVISGASFLLGSSTDLSKSFYMIHRPERFDEIVKSLGENGFDCISWKFIKPFADKNPTMVIFKAQKTGKTERNEILPLVIYRESGVYTDEVQHIYRRKL